MHYWKTKPFLKLLISFGLGIILYEYLDSTIVLTCLVAIMLLLYAGKFTRGYLRFRLPSFQGFLIHLAVLALGFFNMYFHDIRQRPQWFAGKAISKDLSKSTVIFRINGVVKKKRLKCLQSIFFVTTLPKKKTSINFKINYDKLYLQY